MIKAVRRLFNVLMNVGAGLSEIQYSYKEMARRRPQGCSAQPSSATSSTLSVSKMRFELLASALVAVVAAAATPAIGRQSDNNNNTRPLPHKTIFQFNSTGTFLENIAVRQRNGDLVLTLFHPAPASLWTLQAPYSALPRMALVHTFEDAEALVGIAETGPPDTFVVATANFTT